MPTPKPTILCIDDSRENLAFLEGVLAPAGYNVVSASDGPSALVTIRERNIDLVLLDVMMPGMNGFDFCLAVKEDERYAPPPVAFLSAPSSADDRVRGIEAGAEDFIEMPLDPREFLARIRRLLAVKELRDDLDVARAEIADITGFGKTIAASFDPLQFNFISNFDTIVNHIVLKTSKISYGPRIVLVGFIDESHVWQWYQFEFLTDTVRRTWLKQSIRYPLELPEAGGPEGGLAVFYNEEDLRQRKLRPFMKRMSSLSIRVSNAVCSLADSFCIVALNYNKKVSFQDAVIVNSLAFQSLFMKSLAARVRETENAFQYSLRTLARASEAYDEDTGNHNLRVGEYAAVIAKHLGMSEKYRGILRLQAQMHDVGNIRVHPDILRKPGKLSPEEWQLMKEHTTEGAKLLGDHARLQTAKIIAMNHHERWDGGGYHGLKGEQIPLEGRIVSLADQYDAIRNARIYKPAFDHPTAFSILTEGDGRTMPHHFDPQVLDAFKATSSLFEEIHERLQG